MYKLDKAYNEPIYMQIVNQTKSMIARGIFKEGDRLPSVRDLAKSLLVNQSTIARAFKEMEALGMIETVTGKGTFIKLDRRKMDWERERTEDLLKKLFEEAKFLGIGREDILKLYDEMDGEE
ncbi:MAG: GntR family transcriptional regulator [Finegoldia sp.]|nr:GntR family transcriptional regulator [Finegoldia sp.]